MKEESIGLEMERGDWWASLEGDRTQWQLSLVLTGNQGRGVEGHWPASAAMAVVAAMRSALDLWGLIREPDRFRSVDCSAEKSMALHSLSTGLGLADVVVLGCCGKWVGCVVTP